MKVFCFFLIIGISLNVNATVVDDLKKILKSYDDKVAFSLRRDNGEEILSLHGDKLMTPASIAKLISTACSLKELGPQYQFDTQFSFTGKVEGNTLQGDIIVSGKGDPAFVIENLREVLEKIRYLYNIDDWQGQLIFDSSYFGKNYLQLGEGFDGDEGRAFTADLTPTPINNNAFSVWLVPNIRGKGGTFGLLPFGTMNIKTNGKIAEANSAQAKPTAQIAYDPENKTIQVSGSIGKDSEPRGWYRSVKDPYENFFLIFKRLWSELGGKWTKPEYKVTSDKKYKSQLLLTFQSKPLHQILIDTNKFSLNFTAELVLLAAVGHKYGLPVQADKRKEFLSECISKYGADKDAFILQNASGLSRESRLKPQALTQFLNNFSKDPYSSEYLSSLPLLGIDGTMKLILKDYAGMARLKTGTLRDVRSLAGYIYDKSGNRYSIALVFNHLNKGPGSTLEVEEKLLKKILDSEKI